MLKKVIEHFDNEIFILQSPGIATVLVFREHAPNYLKLEDDGMEDVTLCLQTIAKEIVKETKSNQCSFTSYNKHIDKQAISDCVSETLLYLLAAISPKLNTALLQSLLIGNIITSILNNRPTPLQIGIGALMGDHI